MTDRPAMTKVVRSLRSGQITIPVEFRKALDIHDDTLLQMTLVDGELRMRPVAVREQQGSAWLRELYEYFAPVREEVLRRGISEEELNADIDAAVRAVRQEHAADRS
jgi:bifunctional DNA-binding transcriptional regulator/antitoxin component of YhaV-PrlF toxin-antitoxin module